MKTRLLLALLAFSTWGAAQTKTLSGYVRDAATGEDLIGVNIWSPELKVGTSTNAYGFYSFTLPQGEQIIQLTYLGYQNQNFELDLTKNVRLNFDLVPA